MFYSRLKPYKKMLLEAMMTRSIEKVVAIVEVLAATNY